MGSEDGSVMKEGREGKVGKERRRRWAMAELITMEEWADLFLGGRSAKQQMEMQSAKSHPSSGSLTHWREYGHCTPTGPVDSCLFPGGGNYESLCPRSSRGDPCDIFWVCCQDEKGKVDQAGKPESRQQTKRRKKGLRVRSPSFGRD